MHGIKKQHRVGEVGRLMGSVSWLNYGASMQAHNGFDTQYSIAVSVKKYVGCRVCGEEALGWRRSVDKQTAGSCMGSRSRFSLHSKTSK